MVLKFNEYIKEGFLSKTINRFKSGEDRIEDKGYEVKSKEELREIIEERLKKNPNENFNDLDVSKITDMSHLFEGLKPRNIDISPMPFLQLKVNKKVSMNDIDYY